GSRNVSELSLSGTALTASFGGSTVSHTLTVSNAGPNPSTLTTVTDTLPVNTTFVSVSTDQGTCSQASGVVTCNVGGVPVGGTAQVTVVVSINPGAIGTLLTDSASVSAAEVDPLPANNAATFDASWVDLRLTAPDVPLLGAGANATLNLTAANLGSQD